MTFARKPYVKPERAPVVRSSIPLSSPVRMASAASIARAPAAPLPPATKLRSTSTTTAESAHMDRVAELGCLLCGQPAEIHHLREGQGMAQRASNWLTVPLCAEHHRGASGLHGLGERGFARRYRLEELDLLAQTIERLAR